jgi:hypothetical protein
VTITHDTWVRLHPTAKGWNGTCANGVLDSSSVAWLTTARLDSSDDPLSTAMQYTNGGSFDADYSPGESMPGADLTDYRQQRLYSDFDSAWEDPPYPDWGPGFLDCSGYMREVWGYRQGYAWHVWPKSRPNSYSYAQDGAIWRISQDQFFNGPGVVVSDYPKTSGGSPDWSARNVQYDVLRIGDIVFFHTSSTNDVTHEGMYMGLDGAGRRRVLSSRFSTYGPSINFSDDSSQGDAILDGSPTADSLTRTYKAARRF